MSEGEPGPLDEGWNLHRSRHGFSIAHPSDWQVMPSMAGMLVSLIGPGTSDVGRANANVVRRVHDVALDLDGLMESSIRVLQRVLSECLVIDGDVDVVSEVPARRVLIAYRQGIYSLTCQQWILQTDEHIWTVSTGASSEEWPRWASAFDRIGHSFRLGAG